MKILPKKVLGYICFSIILSTGVSSIALATGAQPVVFDRGLGEELAARLSGSYAVKIGDTKMAARAFEKAWLKNRADDEALSRAIQASLISGDVENALRIANSIGANQQNQFANLVIANQAFKNGEYKKVIELNDYSGLNDARLLYGRHLTAWSHALLGHKEEALALMSLKTNNRILDRNAMFSRAMLMQYFNDKDEAKALYLSAYSSGAAGSVGIANYALFLAQNGEKDDALNLLRATDNPIDGLWLNEIHDLIKSGEAQKIFKFKSKDGKKQLSAFGMANISQAILADVKSGSPIGELMMASRLGKDLDVLKISAARFMFSIGLEDDGIATLESISNDGIFGDQAKGILASIKFEKSQSESILAAEQNVKLRPNFTNRANLASLYLLAERYSDCEKIYGSLINDAENITEQAMGLKKWQLYYSRANALLGLKKIDSAIIDLREALKLSPQNPTLLNSLGYTLANNGRNLDEAEQLLQEAAQSRPTSGETIDSLGWVLFKKGRYEEAIDRLEEAMTMAPNVGEIAEHLGDAYWVTNRKEEAKLEWKKSILLHKLQNDKERVRNKIANGIELPALKAIVAQSK